jgi:WD40 repeat protein
MFYATECFALSRDGRYFASAENSSTYTDEIKQGVYPWLVRVWDAASGKVLFSGEKHTNFVRTVSLSPDSKYLASGSVDKTIRIWRLETGENVFTYRGHTNEINTLSWSPDSKRIASSSLWENRIHIWQAT